MIDLAIKSNFIFSASRFISGAPKSVKLKLKGGAYVDPDSELQDKAHVLKSGENLYSAVLGNSLVLCNPMKLTYSAWLVLGWRTNLRNVPLLV